MVITGAENGRVGVLSHATGYKSSSVVHLARGGGTATENLSLRPLWAEHGFRLENKFKNIISVKRDLLTCTFQ